MCKNVTSNIETVALLRQSYSLVFGTALEGMRNMCNSDPVKASKTHLIQYHPQHLKLNSAIDKVWELKLEKAQKTIELGQEGYTKCLFMLFLKQKKTKKTKR